MEPLYTNNDAAAKDYFELVNSLGLPSSAFLSQQRTRDVIRGAGVNIPELFYKKGSLKSLKVPGISRLAIQRLERLFTLGLEEAKKEFENSSESKRRATKLSSPLFYARYSSPRRRG